MSNMLACNYPSIYRRHYSKDDEEDWSDWKNTDKRLGELSGILPLGRTYLNSAMHDSWVISYSKTSTAISISLNDFQSHCFCHAFAARIGVSNGYGASDCTVAFCFSGVHRLAVCHVNRNGKLLPLHTDRFLPLLETWLADDPSLLSPNRIRLGILFWTKRKVKKSNELFLELEAEQLDFREHQREVFLRLFGEEHLKWFDLYMETRQKMEWYFDYSGSIEFLLKNDL